MILAIFISVTYQGSGSVIDMQGKVVSTYQVTLTQTDGEQHIEVRWPDGKKDIHQRIEKTDGNKFRIVGDIGTGGGIDLGEGVITTYMPGPDGSSFAQTIFNDGHVMRLLRTELRDGKAVRFFRESYRVQ